MSFHDWNGNPTTLPTNVTPHWRPCAYAILTHHKKILLVKEQHNMKWNLPGGGTELHEPIVHGLVREIMEETGYRAEVIGTQPIFVGDILHRSSSGDHKRSIPFYFIATLTNETPATDELDEGILDVQWFSFHELEDIDLSYHSQRSIQHYLEHHHDV